MDESPKQLIGEIHPPIPIKPGSVEKIDARSVRNTIVEIFMEVEPLAVKRHVAVTERRVTPAGQQLPSTAYSYCSRKISQKE